MMRRTMRRLRSIALLSCALAAPGPRAARAQGEVEPACRTDYAITARVDEEARRLIGEEVVLFRNETRDDVPDLWFHLYWNAFANDRSTHLVEARGELRELAKRDEWGWQRVTSIRVGDRELLPKLRWRQPDDGRPEDRTVFSVDLPEPVKAGAALEVRVQWEALIPRVRRRTGHKDDFLFVAHWFPKLGVYEQGNGWNAHQFHANTEFYSDYGAYDVELDLPARYEGRIGASGVQAGPARGGDGRVRVRFLAPSTADQRAHDPTGRTPLVHDFVWTADPDFVVHHAVFHADDWAARYADEVARVGLALGRGRGELAMRDVAVTVLVQPERAEQAQRHFDAACTALFFYGLWYGGYPYEHLTVVDPPFGGGAAGGMEYPTVATAGTRLGTFPGMMVPESVTVHEVGHQFWYGLVGNNEFEAAWLDEGFNTYSQNEALYLRYGLRHLTTDFLGRPFDGTPVGAGPGGDALADALSLRRIPLFGRFELEPLPRSGPVDWWHDQPLLSFAKGFEDPRDTDRRGYLADPDTDPIDLAGWLHADRTSYRVNSYRRTATMLRTLAGLVGGDRFLQGMRTFSERWRYAHPYPEDFFAAFQEGARVDVGWFFESAFRSTETVDWSVEVSQRPARAPSGWFLDAEGVFQKQEAAATPENGGGAEERPEHGHEVDLVVRRKGGFLLPLKLELAWADGRRESLVWSREDQARSTWWKPLEGRGPSEHELVSAVLDPDRMYSLDRDLSDNRWYKEPDRLSAWRWAERVVTRWSHLLHGFGGLGG